MRTVLFVFAGRRANLELQLPLVRRILDTHPEVEYHLWDLCRSPEDSEFLHTIEGDRITVRDDFADQSRNGMNHIYRHYSDRSYRDAVFVKMDDDVVFLEVDRFTDFIDAITDKFILSAQIINNGACTSTFPSLWETYTQLADPIIGSVSPRHPLLDVHLSFEYADACHHYMNNHWQDLLHQPVKQILCDDWLSINLIGYTWTTGQRIAAKVGTKHRIDTTIAHRPYKRGRRLGDEGVVNMLPRRIFQGMLAAHLTFGPQITVGAEWDRVKEWRTWYAAIGQKYLDAAMMKP